MFRVVGGDDISNQPGQVTLFHLSNLNESWSQLGGDRDYSRFGTSINVCIWII